MSSKLVMTRPSLEFISSFKSSCMQIKSDMQFRSAIKTGFGSRKVCSHSFPMENSIYATSNKGLFRIDSDGIYRLSSMPMYGCAITREHVFMVAQIHKRSMLVRGDLASRELTSMSNPLILYESRANSTNERIHQINIGAGFLWVANTGRNSILKVDLVSGQVLSEIWPFTDEFGEPFICDQNHINSVNAYGDFIVFTAYKAGGRSLVGLIDCDMNVTGFHYKNKGVHDIYIEEGDFYICDTFGDADEESGGSVITRRGCLAGDVFKGAPGYITRGLVKSGDQIIVGHSHKGVRSKRFKGNGSLLLIRNEKLQSEIKMPFAQTYQLFRSDGLSFDPVPDLSSSAVLGMFRERLDSPAYSASALVRETL